MRATLASFAGTSGHARQTGSAYTLAERGSARLGFCAAAARIATAVRNRRPGLCFELFEKDDEIKASHFVQDTAEMFQKARKYIAIDD